MATNQQLKRELGVVGASLTGLGSIIGTGVFVSTAIATESAGSAVVISVILAAMVAIANGLNSAQLAASHPVSGGTYEYGYRYLNGWLGFSAGWMFLMAKSASAATAAMGIAEYVLSLSGLADRSLITWIALGVVLLMTVIVYSGIRQSNRANMLIIGTTLTVLTLYVVSALLLNTNPPAPRATNSLPNGIVGVLQATALIFVAYTGYGRIATLGEEVIEPRRTIPRAMIFALGLTMVLYVLVIIASLHTIGYQAFAQTTAQATAPLVIVSQSISVPYLPTILSIGAVTAMLGVLLNLILGLSRVFLAMGRRKDLPTIFAHINTQGTTPTVAVWGTAVLIAIIILVVGDIRVAWSFSAINVLIYYGITNLSALQLQREERMFPRWVTILGLVMCLFLTVWISVSVYTVVLILLAVGLAVKFAVNSYYARLGTGKNAV
ncbi:MAG: APC family permease [Phototrophicaceae bacterium]